MSVVRSAIILFVVFVLQVLPALAGSRVALVVGNAAYRHAPPLANPANDASDMAKALEKVGFKVILGIDLDKSAFDRKLRAFARALGNADTAVVFYAGHGLQVAGQNYLVPVDAKLESERDLDFEAVNLNFVLRQMEIDRLDKTNIVFLDACRDNPLARNLARSMGTRSASIGRGLAPVKTGVGTFIAYSTQPGNVALDGTGRNSPFTGALLKHIDDPGRNLTSLMIGVRKKVLAETDGKQVPWDHSALTGEFYFNLASAAGHLPKKAFEPAPDGLMAARVKELEKELKKKSDPRQTENMIELAQARERVRSLQEDNRQDQMGIFDIRRRSSADAADRNRTNREIGKVMLRMARRSQEMKRLRERIAALEKQLGVTAKEAKAP